MSTADKHCKGRERHTMLVTTLASLAPATSARRHTNKIVAIIMLLAALVIAWSAAGPTNG
jgi:hypothetical protein